jgi:hypothetical protein
LGLDILSQVFFFIQTAWGLTRLVQTQDIRTHWSLSWEYEQRFPLCWAYRDIVFVASWSSLLHPDPLEALWDSSKLKTYEPTDLWVKSMNSGFHCAEHIEIFSCHKLKFSSSSRSAWALRGSTKIQTKERTDLRVWTRTSVSTVQRTESDFLVSEVGVLFFIQIDWGICEVHPKIYMDKITQIKSNPPQCSGWSRLISVLTITWEDCMVTYHRHVC